MDGSRRAFQYGFDPRTVRHKATPNDSTGRAETCADPAPAALVVVGASGTPFLPRRRSRKLITVGIATAVLSRNRGTGPNQASRNDKHFTR